MPIKNGFLRTNSMYLFIFGCAESLLLLRLLAQTVKASAYNAGDPGLIPESGRSPGEGNSTPLHYSCLGNPIERGAWQATVPGVTRVVHGWATERMPSVVYQGAFYLHSYQYLLSRICVTERKWLKNHFFNRKKEKSGPYFQEISLWWQPKDISSLLEAVL